MKNKKLSRIVSLMLSIAMLCSMALAGTGAASAADTVYEKTNLIVDPGFDLPNGFVIDNSIDRWNNWNVSKSSEGRSGSCVKFSAMESSLQYKVDGSTLQAGVTYVFSIWVKVESGDRALQVGVRDYGGSTLTTAAAGNQWTKYSVKFTYISGNPILYVYNNTGITPPGAVACVDDASLTVEGAVDRAEITNGSITVQGDGLVMSKFTAVWASSLNPGVSRPLDLTVSGSTLRFESIAAVALAQTITVILSYEGTNITLSFDVEASGGDVVPVQIDTLSVMNGTAAITLKAMPTAAPASSDFQYGLLVDGGKASFRISAFTYDNDKTVTVSFDPVSSSLSADKAVTLTVSCGGTSASGSFTVAKGTSHTYYVSSSTGSDQNDGLTPESAFRSIAKLNTLTFVPGDHILFKAGDTFMGMFKPSGSGAEGAPIVVSSYGGGARPVIQPDPNGEFEYVLGAGNPTNRKVNGTVWLENVDHWEIRGLELHDPSYDPEFYLVGSLDVYNAAVRVVNVDQGDLSHFIFDDLVIHGFRGPGTNPGKASGGIQFNVGTQAVVPVPSCFVDVSITNCEIYECGRDGINSLSVWGYRRYTSTGAAWPSFPTGQYMRKCSYYPGRNLYVANNSIHHIDGDGLIVDTWSNAVVENNEVYRCAIHLSNPFQAAVGMFNWNSDNVVFQYNECYSNGINGTRHAVGSTTVQQSVTAQDGQGIEVDALNQDTWVQFNYLHDNAAFMMLCCENAIYTSINTCVRYNVSKNEGSNLPNTSNGMGWFLNGDYGINTQVYNNTFVIAQKDLDSSGEFHMLKYNSNQYKFYNNIFCYTGSGPVTVRAWQDDTDYQSNIFINFAGLPAQDNAAHPNITLTAEEGEALFTGGTDVDAYRLATGAYSGMGTALPSMDDGMFSGVDLAGNPVPTVPGIGAFEYVG